MRQRQAEKERERRHTGVPTEVMAVLTARPSIPFVSPAAASNAMEVDATHTREEFVCRMRGKCFGCGSVAHNKRDGNHECEICTYCRHVGHRDVVCLDKFLGKPKGQQIAAMMEELEREVESLRLSPGEFEKIEEVKIAATTSVTLTQLLEQQKQLSKQISAWREQDF